MKDCKSEKNTINTTEEEKENLENIIYERNAKWINIGEFLIIIWLLLGVIGSIVVGTIFGINMKNVYNEINNILISMTLSIVLLFVCTSTFVFNIIIIHIAETVHKKLD